MQIRLLEFTDGIIDKPTWFRNFKALPERQPRKGRKIPHSRAPLNWISTYWINESTFGCISETTKLSR